MPRRSTLLLSAWVLLAALPARAEDPPPPPPPAPPDFLLLVRSLKERLAEHETPPAKTDRDHALHDAWTSILRPRAARMTARAKGLLLRKRWRFETHDGVERAAGLLPGEWDAAIREMSMLYVELGGALEQYLHVKVTLTTPLGDPGTPVPPHPSGDPLDTQRAIEELERDFWARWSSGQVLFPEQLQQYWILLASLERELVRREEALRRWEEAMRRVEDALARLSMGFQFQRENLKLEMLAVRSLVAALQAAEEDRLGREVAERLAPGTDARARAGELLVEMAAGRLAAEGLDEPPVSQYGSILRSRWLRPRAKLTGLLKP
jgi:hypothetical protein